MITLAGTWRFRLDPQIEIPAPWQGKRLRLFLERCHWETRAWVDGRFLGAQDSLCTPHVYDLGMSLRPGKHRLTICVDNTPKHFLARFASSSSEETQTNWNGIIGRIELRAADPIWIDALDVYPDMGRKRAEVRLRIGNAAGAGFAARLTVKAASSEAAPEIPPKRSEFTAEGPHASVVMELPTGEDVRLWDEFSPVLYDLTALLSARSGGKSYTDERRASFGMRKLGVSPEKQFTLNGRTIYLRGTLDCCIFPRTGYPAMDVEGWARIMRTCRSYGLNHLRFHSWCPPEAAFTAADRSGLLLQVEAPRANVGQDPLRDGFIEEEGKRILDCYGNHPSFGAGNWSGWGSSGIRGISIPAPPLGACSGRASTTWCPSAACTGRPPTSIFATHSPSSRFRWGAPLPRLD